MNPTKAQQILQDPEFIALSRRKNSFSLALTLLTFVVYFGFIFLLAFNPSVLAAPVAGDVNWGLPVGVAVIVFCWILTGLYVRWANDSYDKMVARLSQNVAPESEESA